MVEIYFDGWNFQPNHRTIFSNEKWRNESVHLNLDQIVNQSTTRLQMVQVLIVYKLWTKISLLQNPRKIIAFMSILTIFIKFIFVLARKSYTRGCLSGPEKFLTEFILTWWTWFENVILVQIFTSNLDQIADSNQVKVLNSIFIWNWWSRVKMWFWSTFTWFESAILVQIRSKNLDKNHIFESSSSRENKLLQKFFWTKKYTPAWVVV